MTFLFITPIFDDFSGIRNYSAPNLGIFRIISYLEKHNVKSDILDFDLTPTTPADFILKYKANPPKFIGISVLNANLIHTINYVNEIGEHFPDSTFICGGAEATLNYQELFDRCKYINAVVLAEGEEVCLELARGNNPQRIKGLIWREHAEAITADKFWEYWESIDFSRMGYKEYWDRMEVLYSNPNIDEIRTVRLVTSSFCPRKCNFCSVSIIHEFACGKTIKPVYLSADQMDVLLTKIKSQLPDTRTIYECSDDFLTNPIRAREIIPVLKKHNHFIYLIQTFSTRLNRDLVRDLASANVKHITCGIESPSERVRKLMGKPQSSDHIENVIEWCKEFGINPYYLIILFPPEINYQELQEGVKTLRRWLNKGVTISIEPFLMPYKGATLFNSHYDMDYTSIELKDGSRMRLPIKIYPSDMRVREIMKRFKDGWETFLSDTCKRENQNHIFKGYTGKVMVEFLEELMV